MAVCSEQYTKHLLTRIDQQQRNEFSNCHSTRGYALLDFLYSLLRSKARLRANKILHHHQRLAYFLEKQLRNKLNNVISFLRVMQILFLCVCVCVCGGGGGRQVLELSNNIISIITSKTIPSCFFKINIETMMIYRQAKECKSIVFVCFKVMSMLFKKCLYSNGYKPIINLVFSSIVSPSSVVYHSHLPTPLSFPFFFLYMHTPCTLLGFPQTDNHNLCSSVHSKNKEKGRRGTLDRTRHHACLYNASGSLK